jgi:hypothetical protein
MARKPKETKVIHRKLGRERAWGLADSDKNTIEIDERLSGYKYMEIALHELYHCKHPDWSESKIVRESRATAKFLWKAGFRWVDLK